MIEQPSSDFWRSKAEEYWIVAESAREPTIRTIYFKLAANCDAPAARQERIAGVTVGKSH